MYPRKGAGRARSIEDRQHLTRELQAVDLLIEDKRMMQERGGPRGLTGEAPAPGQAGSIPYPPPPEQRSPFEMPGVVRPEIQKALPPASGNNLPAPPQGQIEGAPPEVEPAPPPPTPEQKAAPAAAPEPVEPMEPAPEPPVKKAKGRAKKAAQASPKDGEAAAPVATLPPQAPPPGAGATAEPVQTETTDDGAATRASSLTRLTNKQISDLASKHGIDPKPYLKEKTGAGGARTGRNKLENAIMDAAEKKRVVSPEDSVFPRAVEPAPPPPTKQAAEGPPGIVAEYDPDGSLSPAPPVPKGKINPLLPLEPPVKAKDIRDASCACGPKIMARNPKNGAAGSTTWGWRRQAVGQRREDSNGTPR